MAVHGAWRVAVEISGRVARATPLQKKNGTSSTLPPPPNTSTSSTSLTVCLGRSAARRAGERIERAAAARGVAGACIAA